MYRKDSKQVVIKSDSTLNVIILEKKIMLRKENFLYYLHILKFSSTDHFNF